MCKLEFFGIAALLTILLMLHSSEAEDDESKNYSSVAPSFVINLDEKPQERWKEVAETLASNISVAIDECMRIAVIRFKMSSEELMRDFWLLGSLLRKKPHSKEYFEEMDGISKYSKISKQRIYFFNLHVDYLIKGTSLTDFGRNQSVWLLKVVHMNATRTMRHMGINVDFRRRGTTAYKGATFAGMVGVNFGLRENELVVSYFRRVAPYSMKQRLKVALAIAKNETKIQAPSLLMRNLLADEKKSFKEVIKFVFNISLTAPIGITVSLPKELDVHEKHPLNAAILFRTQKPDDIHSNSFRLGGRAPLTHGSWNFDLEGLNSFADETFCTAYINQASYALKWKVRTLKNPRNGAKFSNYTVDIMKYIGFFGTQRNSVMVTVTSAQTNDFAVRRVVRDSVMEWTDNTSSSKPCYLLLLLAFLCIISLH